jgi:hypothetical protein
MANFQKAANDYTTRFDTGIGRLVLMLGENSKIDLWGGGPPGTELVVDVNDTSMVTVTAAKAQPALNVVTYELKPLKAGNVMLEARVFDMCPTEATRRRDWFSKPVWAYIQVSVLGNDFMQSGGTWGQTKYGSTNQAWKNVTWTTMGYAGCGPTALANVLDYLFRLYVADGRGTGITPQDTMGYTSEYGRYAGPSKDGTLEPQGTSGDIMIKNLDKRWPGYAGEEVTSVDLAVRWLRMGTPLIFLANGATTTWKYNAKGTRDVHRWGGGHYMVLVGVENGPDDAKQQFWVADPSRARTRYTSRADLQTCRIWRVFKKDQ